MLQVSHEPNVNMCVMFLQLSERPTFMADGGSLLTEKWKPINHFAPNHPSSMCRFVLLTMFLVFAFVTTTFDSNPSSYIFRRHALYFEPGVLKANYSKIIADSFWSRTLQVPFPSLPGSLFFNDGQGNSPVRDNSQNATANQLLGTQGTSQHNPQEGTSQQNPQEDLLGTQGTSQQSPQEAAKRGEKRKELS